jgi:2-hydroxycyclohexanecarboxyl-CoA dehydrogenase
MELGLTDARVLVTGGASNIGRGIVHGFAAEGSRITLCDIDVDQAERVAQEALDRGAKDVRVVGGDLSAPEVPERAVATTVSAWDGLDAVVNNAGWSVPGFLGDDTDRGRWQRLVEVNLFASIATTQAALPHLVSEGAGSIVFVSSDAAFGQIRQGVYGATKAAVVALARTTAKEYGRKGVRSNIVCPGLVLPEGPEAIGTLSLWASDAAIFDAKQTEFMTKGTPMRRLSNAADVANAVVWLSSGVAAKQITGQMFSVSGGYTMP